MITTIVNFLLLVVGWLIQRDKSNADAKAAFLLFVEQMQQKKLIPKHLNKQDKKLHQVLKARWERLQKPQRVIPAPSGAVQISDKVIIRGHILKCTAITGKRPPWKYVFEITNR